jgi:cytoskeletal protein CcmA (bactofilin family)
MAERRHHSIAGLTVCLWGMAALLCGSAGAVEFKTGEQVTIGPQQVIEDDLYMTGDTMTVEGRVKGDVVAAGRVVRIEGVVEGDLIAAGQVIEITGQVLDDVRIAGMTLKTEPGARVGDDCIAAGFSFESAPQSEVGGNTRLMGFQALIGGVHLQGLEASVVGLLISGRVNGGVEAMVESQAGPAWWTRFMQSPVPIPSVSPGLRLTGEAVIDGDLSYRSVAEADIADGARVSGETHHEVRAVEPVEGPSRGERLGKTLRWGVVLLLVGATLLWGLPDKTDGIATILLERPLASLGWGCVTLLGFPVAMVMLLVLTFALAMLFGLMTLGGAVALVLVLGAVTIGLLSATLWVSVVYLAPAMVSLAGGRWLLTRVGRQERSRFLGLLVGLLLLALLALIPFVGSTLRWLVALIGVGAGALWSVRHLARSQAS